MAMDLTNVSIVIPAKNESAGLSRLLPRLTELYPNAELIVVDDGSSDETAAVATNHGARAVSHPYSMGNGAAIKAGARAASRKIIVCMDADGQHQPEDVSRLLKKINEGYDMVVGARSRASQSNIGRWLANVVYNRLSSWMVGRRIEDLTSGFRAVRADKFRKFLYLLPNGFSYPTTITMAFFRSAYSVAYVPISAEKRQGKSKLKMFKDGTRFFIIILKVGALFSPMRLFLPVSFGLFLIGLSYYAYSYINYGRFTNMSALLFIASMLAFLIGIVSEQISALHFRHHSDDD
jgi:glycosyltransferase involved in cell wall biosynthesis